MKQIYVFGHKNPDTDSICSAISLCELKKNQGIDVIPCRLGNISKETQFALNYFKAEAPTLINSIELDENGKKREVILVDHNEKFQTVDGIENARIIEIVDHHKFGLTTDEPLKITADSVGCSCTLVYRLFKQNGIIPSKMAAGLMMSAIISDTLLFKSPTCTPEDVEAVKELSKICGEENFEEYGMKLLIEGTSLSDKTPEEIITIDMKEFEMSTNMVAIAQVNTVDVAGLLNMQKELENAMESMSKKSNYKLFVLVITDIIKAGSYVLVTGDIPELVENAFGVKLENKVAWLEDVVSRKKQVVPFMLEASQK